MRTLYFTLAVLVAINLTGCNEAKSPIALQKEILTESQKLEQSIVSLRDSVAASNSPKSISKQFKAARLQYKKVEWALEYFLPQILNPDAEINPAMTHDIYFRPRDFEDMDSIVQSGNIAGNKEIMLEEINSMLNNSKSITAYLETIDLGNEAVSGIE